MRRHKMGKKQSRKSFKYGAARVHKKNTMGAGYSMRGGIRL